MEKVELIERIDFLGTNGEGFNTEDVLCEGEFWRRNDTARDPWEQVALQWLAAPSRFLGLDDEGRFVFAVTPHYMKKEEFYRYLMDAAAFDPFDPYAALAAHCGPAVKAKSIALALSPQGLKKVAAWLRGLFQGA